MQQPSARLGNNPELQNSGLMHLQPASQNEIRTPKGISKLGAFPLKIKNHFVSEKKSKSGHDSVIERGFEHDNDVTTDEEFYQKIFNHNLYNPTSENLIDYFLEIRRMMDSVDDKDTGNVGTVVGMTVFGLFGFLGFSFTIVGGIAAGVLGGTLGRYAGKKLRRKIKKKGPITQEEIFITKIQCMIKVGKLQKEFLKHNLNKYRILIERIIEESSMGFNTQIFQDQKKIIKVVTKLRDFMVSVLPQKAILLTYKLFKIHFKQMGLEDPENAKEAASKLNKVLIPYIRLIEINDKASSKTIKKLSNLVTYQKIRKLLLKPEIIKLLERYPDPKEEPEYIAKFTELLRQQVNFDQQFNFNAQELQNLEENQNQTYVRSPEVSAIANAGPTENILESPPVKPRLTVNTASVDKSMESINSADLEEKNDLFNQLPNKYGTSKFKNPNTQGSESERTNTGPNKPVTNTQPVMPKSPKTAFFEGFKDENMAPQNNNENEESSEDSSVNKDHEESVEKLADDSALYHKDLSHVLAKTSTKAKSDKPVEESKEQKQHINLEKVLDKNSISHSNPKHSAGLKTPKFDQSPMKKQTVYLENVEVDFDPSRTIAKPELVKMNSFSNVTLHDEESKKDKKEEVLPPAPIDTEAAKLTITHNKSQSKTKKEIVFEKIISIAYDNVSKWDKVMSNSQITIHKIKPENSPVVLLRAWAVLEGVPVRECFDQIFDADSRQKWDTVLDTFRVVDSIDSETEVIHFIIKTPFGITERDFVQKRQHQHDYPEPGTSMISFQSTTHPAVPPFKNRVRGETHIAGYIIKPCKHDPNSTDLCILTQVDIKGNIPKAIVNMFAGKAPADWFNKLKKACMDARKKKK